MRNPSSPRPLAPAALALVPAMALALIFTAAAAAQETSSSPSSPSAAPPNLPAAGLAPPPAATAPVGPEWQALPIWAADVRSMIVAPDDPDLVLAGTTTGQLYLSRDGGASWQDAGPPLQFAGWVVSSLRWDPNRPHRLWVSLWGVWGSGQVACSDDLGKSWAARSAGLPPQEPVYSLALVPGREGRLFAGTLSGVYGTEDGGASWRRLTADQPDMEKVTSLLVDPTRTDTVIAGTWRRAYRSDDCGRTWSGIFEGMVLDTEVFSITAVPEHPGEIWASSCGWVYRTLDHGDHWMRFKDFDERRTLSFAVLPDGRLLAGTVSGVFTSSDSGKSWRRLSDPALSVSAIAYHPARPDRILIGTEGAGVWRSTNAGVDFFRSSRGMTATRAGALALAGNDLLVAVNHAGLLSGIYTSRDHGRSFDADFTAMPTVLDLTVAGSHVYAATVSGLYERRGVDWHRLPELGTERVEEVVAQEGPGGHLVARTAHGIFEQVKGVFVLRPYKHGPPRSAAFFGGGLWVSDAEGLYELTREANHTVAAPFAGGHLHRLGEQLLLAGAGGAWARQGPGAEWVQLTAEASRVVPTGDGRFAALLLSGDAVRLYDAESHRFRVLRVPVPGRDVVAALVVDGKLLLATSGYGVLARDVPAGE